MGKPKNTSATSVLRLGNNDSKRSQLSTKVSRSQGLSKKDVKGRINTPVNAIIRAMEILNGRNRGVPIEKIRTFLQENYEIPCKPEDVDKKINMTVKFAVYFGILEKRHGLYYLRSTKLAQLPFRR